MRENTLAGRGGRKAIRASLAPPARPMRRPLFSTEGIRARRSSYRTRGTRHATVGRTVVILAWGDGSGYELRELLGALSRQGLQPKLCHPDFFGITVERKLQLTYRGKLLGRPALVLARTGSATGGLPEAILRQFELMGVPVVNSVAAIQAAMNKAHALQRLARVVPIPLTHVYTSLGSAKKKVALWTGVVPLRSKGPQRKSRQRNISR
jgi:hypothetical protein